MPHHATTNFAVDIYRNNRANTPPFPYRAAEMMDPDDIDQLFIEIQKRYPTARWAEGTIIIRPEGTETIDAYRARNFMRAIVKRGVKALA